MKIKIKFFHIKFIISFVIIVTLIWIVKDFDLGNIEFDLNISRISVLMLILIISLILRAYRWQLLMNSKLKSKLSFLFSFKLLLIGQSLNVIMPAGTGEIANGYSGQTDPLFR